jgi:hypothetical protein
MNEFRPNQSRYRTINALRKPMNLVLEYRMVEILHKLGMSTFGSLLLPFHILMGQFILFSNVSALRGGKDFDFNFIILSFYAQAAWFCVLEFGGRFHKNSTKTVKSWKYFNFKTKAEAKYMSKFRKACVPLCLEAKGVFSVKRLSVLKFIRSVVRGTFRAVLTLNSFKLM